MTRTGPSGRTISRRPVPGTDRTVSVLGFSLEGVPAWGADSDRAAAALLRLGRARGISLIDLPEGPGADRLERIVALAFPDPDPDLTVLVQRSPRSVGSSGRRPQGAPSSPGWAAALARSVGETNERIGPHRVALVDWQGSVGEDPGATDDALRDLAAIAGLAGVVRRWDPTVPAPAATPPADRLLSGSFSVLDQRPARVLGPTAGAGRVGFFAREPLASGRLDASRLLGPAGPPRPGMAPPPVRELEQEFAPVLALGFLTSGHRRTLAQASLRYVLRWPWTVSALIPLPSAERLEELADLEQVPDLTDDEMARLGTLTTMT